MMKNLPKLIFLGAILISLRGSADGPEGIRRISAELDYNLGMFQSTIKAFVDYGDSYYIRWNQASRKLKNENRELYAASGSTHSDPSLLSLHCSLVYAAAENWDEIFSEQESQLAANEEPIYHRIYRLALKLRGEHQTLASACR
jgi:hypothetical protein